MVSCAEFTFWCNAYAPFAEAYVMILVVADNIIVYVSLHKSHCSCTCIQSVKSATNSNTAKRFLEMTPNSVNNIDSNSLATSLPAGNFASICAHLLVWITHQSILESEIPSRQESLCKTLQYISMGVLATFFTMLLQR